LGYELQDKFKLTMKKLLEQIKEKYPKSSTSIYAEIHSGFSGIEIEYSVSFTSDLLLVNTIRTKFYSYKALTAYLESLITPITPDTIEQAEKIMEEIEG